MPRRTERLELVETHNIALALDRLQKSPYDMNRWKRALYHAVAMSHVGSDITRKIREALELP